MAYNQTPLKTDQKENKKQNSKQSASDAVKNDNESGLTIQPPPMQLQNNVSNPLSNPSDNENNGDEVLQMSPAKMFRTNKATTLINGFRADTKKDKALTEDVFVTFIEGSGSMHKDGKTYRKVEYRSRGNNLRKGFVPEDDIDSVGGGDVDTDTLKYIDTHNAEINTGGGIVKLSLGDSYQVLDYDDKNDEGHFKAKVFSHNGMVLTGYLKASNHHDQMAKYEKRAEEMGMDNTKFIGPKSTRNEHRKPMKGELLGFQVAGDALGKMYAPDKVKMTSGSKSLMAQQSALSGMAGKVQRLGMRDVTLVDKYKPEKAEKLKDHEVDRHTIVDLAEIEKRRRKIRQDMYGDNAWGLRFKKLHKITKKVQLVAGIISAISLLLSLGAIGFPPLLPVSAGFSFAAICMSVIFMLLKAVLMGRNIYRLITLPKGEKGGALRQLLRDTLEFLITGIAIGVGAGVSGDFTQVFGGYGGVDVSAALSNESNSAISNAIAAGVGGPLLAAQGLGYSLLSKKEDKSFKKRQDLDYSHIKRGMVDPREEPIQGKFDPSKAIQRKKGDDDEKKTSKPKDSPADILKYLESMSGEEISRTEGDIKQQSKNDALLGDAEKRIKGESVKAPADIDAVEEKVKEGSSVVNSYSPDENKDSLSEAESESAIKKIDEKQGKTSVSSEKKKGSGKGKRMRKLLKKKVNNIMVKVKRKMIALTSKLPGIKDAMADIKSGISEDKGKKAELDATLESAKELQKATKKMKKK